MLALQVICVVACKELLLPVANTLHLSQAGWNQRKLLQAALAGS